MWRKVRYNPLLFTADVSAPDFGKEFNLPENAPPRNNVQVIRHRPTTESAPGTRPGRAPAGVRSVVTIGNFDGVHRGHQALINQCQELASPGDQLAVVTFEPLPQALFRPEDAPARLSTIRQKLQCLAALGVHLTWLLKFDRKFSRLSAHEFVQQVLVNRLAARHVVVGHDFRFGHQRTGDRLLLTSLGEEAGFQVHTVDSFCDHDLRISSTVIRQALAAGDFPLAARLLGRPFRMEGRVVQGQQLGRTLGYPTANLRIRARPSPLQGIFAVFCRVCDGTDGAWLPAVSSLGCRPTVGGEEPLLEVHFFDFDRDLYGKRLEVEFVAKLRDETRFDTVDELMVQMRRDETAAREILATLNQPA